MQTFELAVTCLVITAVMAFINRRWLKMPAAIGAMSAALITSLAALALDHLGEGALRELDARLLESIDFSDVLIQGMLSLLLFAGSLNVDVDGLRDYAWQVSVLALLSTALSTALIGCGAYWLLPVAGLHLSLGYCLVLGALISPTDPIAVLKVLPAAGAQPALETVIAGEALFNDGFGVVLFTLALALVTGQEVPSAGETVLLFVREAGGGLLFGVGLGALLTRMVRGLRDSHEAVLVTLAGVLGGYMLANRLGLSGPLAMVAAGLVVGRSRRARGEVVRARTELDIFWESLDAILNSVLFVLMGLEGLFLPLNAVTLAAGAIIIAVSLGARYLSVGLPVQCMARTFRLPHGAWRVLTWGGLRGSISIALALSLPIGVARDVIFALTYCLVVFSILGQGLSMRRVVATALKA